MIQPERAADAADAAGAAGVAIASELVPGFAERGLHAFTTTRLAGSFNLASSEPAAEVFGRWQGLMAVLRAPRLASAHQVHGSEVLLHVAGWSGWLRAVGADGHFSREPGTAMAVSLADCVPIFMADRSGGAAILHSGWKGTAARIVERAIAVFRAGGTAPAELLLHLGPAICGTCYVVGPDVYTKLTGRSAEAATTVDLRALIAEDARRCGVREISISPWCTRCHNERFFSHRAGDSGRQLGVIATRAPRRRERAPAPQPAGRIP